MTKVITYGTYDLLHYGHIRLLERAKALGDYLIVGITSDDYDKTRGKINNQQSLGERIEAVRKTGLADKIIVEEYEGQKIDDIRKYGVEIFTVGSDWSGYFDYLSEYCKVIYLPRTEGISSTEIRSEKRSISLGLVGNSQYLNRIVSEAKYVNGIILSGLCADDLEEIERETKKLPLVTSDFSELLNVSDAVYIHSMPELHYKLTKAALQKRKHVICESPLAFSQQECIELYEIAKANNCVLIDALRTAYATAFNRLVLFAKGGKIGKIVSIDAVCTSLRDVEKIREGKLSNVWDSISAWGPTALLPILEILGKDYIDCRFESHFTDETCSFDTFTKISFTYPDAVASIKVGTGVKSESELIISGTKGYIYVPSPWWKTDYFEVRFENPAENKRFFYQLNGEGIRNQFADFARNVEEKSSSMYITEALSKEICRIMEAFKHHHNMVII